MNGQTQQLHQKIVTQLESVLPGLVKEFQEAETAPLREEIATLKKMFNEAQEAIMSVRAEGSKLLAEQRAATEEMRQSALERANQSEQKHKTRLEQIDALNAEVLAARGEIQRLTAELSTARTNG